MTDRELLEMAAKAAGIEYKADSGYRVTGVGTTGMPHLTEWNPLIDDGDALRLAVKLRIGLEFESYEVIENPTRTYSNEEAIRRAIVRAAAAIGAS